MASVVVTRCVQRSRTSAGLFGQVAAWNKALASNSARRLSLSRVNHDENSALTEAGLVSKEPFANFRHWYDQVVQSKAVMEPNAVSVATATKDGRPSTRMVLLNGFDDNGLQFFTKYTSKKGRDLEENPYVCMMFYWETLFKVVRIQGSVEKLSEQVSTKYFHLQPRNIQLVSCVSPQSSPIADLQTLGADFGAAMEKYKDESIPIPKPESWGGYLLKPDHVEFWQGHADRFPDRFVFRKPAPEETIDPNVTQRGDNGWWYERLAP